MVGQTTAVVRVDLRALAKQINTAHTAFVDGMRQTLPHAVRAGELLLEVKERLPHGEWMSWLKDNFAAHHETARRYMLLAGRLPELEANSTSVWNLTLTGALRALKGLDDPDEPGGARPDHPTPWTVQDIITNTTAYVAELCDRTPPDYRDLLAKRLRDLAAEIEQRGGVA